MSNRLLRWMFAAALAALLPTCYALAVPPPNEAQGLSLTLQPLHFVGVDDARPARLLALYVEFPFHSPSPFTPFPFRATWEGDLNLKVREKWGFRAEGKGKLTITIDDKVVLQVEGEDFSKVVGEQVRLKKGKNHLKAVYESPEDRDAVLRVFWFQDDVPPEPIAPTALTYDPTAPLVAEGIRRREGRFLLGEYRCTKCHAPPDKLKDAALMSELRMDAPSLADVGSRLNRDWIAAWVRNPYALRPTARMPRVVADAAQAADVAAYLATLQGDRPVNPPPAALPTDEQVREGAKLFAGLNCIGCHVPPGHLVKAPVMTDPPRVPLDYVASKFKPRALVQFLLNPQAHYAWNPMPNFKLADDEAQRLAAFLLKHGTKALAAVLPPGDARRGKALVASAGCLNCHPVQGQDSALKPPPALAAVDKEHWSRGCLAHDPAERGHAPEFPLMAEQKRAIAFYATTAGLAFESLKHASAGEVTEFAGRQYAALRCNACHARDGQESLIASTLAAEVTALTDQYLGRDTLAQGDTGGSPLGADQRAPTLTWAGEKLRGGWMFDFIKGKVPYKPRPYLRSRMPAFPNREAIALGLSMEHGYSWESPLDDSGIAQDFAATGQRLIGQANGFSCVQCHAVGDAPPLAPFEAPALNFAYVHERLRKPYYDRWMHNPLRVDPTTKMPQYANEGTTAIRDVFEGNAQKQFDAIWEFLRRGKDVAAPK
jgi:mono/diheme cytochrome c family protein